MKAIAKKELLIAKYRGKFDVVRFNEDRNRYFECIPDVWYVDDSKEECFWPPRTGKSFSYRAMTGEQPNDTWEIVKCTVISEGHVTYSIGFQIVREKCAQTYNTSSADDELQARKFRREHPALVLNEQKSFEHIFNKPRVQLQQNNVHVNNISTDIVQQPSDSTALNPTTCSDKTSLEYVDGPSTSTAASKPTNLHCSSSSSSKKKTSECQQFSECKRPMVSTDSRKLLAKKSPSSKLTQRSRTSSRSRLTPRKVLANKPPSSLLSQRSRTPSKSRSTSGSRSSSRSRSSSDASRNSDNSSKRSQLKSIVSENSKRRRISSSRSQSVVSLISDNRSNRQYDSRSELNSVDNNSSANYPNQPQNQQYPESEYRLEPVSQSLSNSSVHRSTTDTGIKRSRSIKIRSGSIHRSSLRSKSRSSENPSMRARSKSIRSRRSHSKSIRSRRSRSKSIRSRRSRSKSIRSRRSRSKSIRSRRSRSKSIRSRRSHSKSIRSRRSRSKSIRSRRSRSKSIRSRRSRSKSIRSRRSHSKSIRSRRSRSKSIRSRHSSSKSIRSRLSRSTSIEKQQSRQPDETRNRHNHRDNNSSTRTSCNNTRLLGSRYTSRSPHLFDNHTSRREVSHSRHGSYRSLNTRKLASKEQENRTLQISNSTTNFVFDLKNEIKDVQITLKETNEHLAENESRLERIEVTVNKAFLLLGDMAQRNYSIQPEHVSEEAGNEADFDVPRLPIRDHTKLTIFQKKLKDSKFKDFLVNREKEFCSPIGRQTDTVTITKYLQRFISLSMRNKIPLKEKCQSASGVTLFDHFHRVYEYLIEVMKAGYKTRNKEIMVDDAYQALRVVWGRTKQMIKEKERKDENRNRKKENKNCKSKRKN